MSLFVVTFVLGSRPRQRGCKVVGQEGGPGVASHGLGSVKSAKECEGMNPHTPK